MWPPKAIMSIEASEIFKYKKRLVYLFIIVIVFKCYFYLVNLFKKFCFFMGLEMLPFI